MSINVKALRWGHCLSASDFRMDRMDLSTVPTDDASPMGAPDLRIMAADSNVLNVQEMPAGEEGDKYGSCLAAAVGSQMVWVECPIRDVMKECAESYSTAFLWWFATRQSRRPPDVSPLHFSTSNHRTDA